MYLPFSITLGYGIGCLASMGLEWRFGARFIEDKIVPLAAGLIVGEALTALGFSVFKILSPPDATAALDTNLLGTLIQGVIG